MSSDLSYLKCMEYQFNPEGLQNGQKGITILYTGYGPFGEYEVNPSWEAVSKLPFCNVRLLLPPTLSPTTPVKVVGYEIPVVYQSVTSIVPKLWSMHNPDLVVHVGLGDSDASYFRIEEGAPNTGYNYGDNLGETPPGYVCVSRGSRMLKTRFDVRRVAEAYNARKNVVRMMVSPDAGAYLTGFIYYKSLSIDKSKVAFIHVSDFHHGFGTQDMATCLCYCTSELLTQLQERNALKSEETE